MINTDKSLKYHFAAIFLLLTSFTKPYSFTLLPRWQYQKLSFTASLLKRTINQKQKNKIINAIRINEIEVDHDMGDYGTPLVYAAKIKRTEIAKALILAGAQRNAKDSDLMTPLHHAIENEDEELALYLIEGMADLYTLDKFYKTPLEYASTGMMKKIFKKFPKIKNYYEFHEAIKQGDLKKVKKLVENNKKLIKHLFKFESTPLHIAARHGKRNIAEYLLSKGANIHAKTIINDTSLDYTYRFFWGIPLRFLGTKPQNKTIQKYLLKTLKEKK